MYQLQKEQHVSTTYQQAALAIQDPDSFRSVSEAIVAAFSPARAADFLRSVERASLRVRNFEGVVERGLLGVPTAAGYKGLMPGDQGQIRELYLASLERIPSELRDRYFKLYAYY